MGHQDTRPARNEGDDEEVERMLVRLPGRKKAFHDHAKRPVFSPAFPSLFFSEKKSLGLPKRKTIFFVFPQAFTRSRVPVGDEGMREKAVL
jgi:hypothetical protein